jgi:hypothetical protein
VFRRIRAAERVRNATRSIYSTYVPPPSATSQPLALSGVWFHSSVRLKQA